MRERGTFRLIAALAAALAGFAPAAGLAQTIDVPTLEDPTPVSVGQPQDVALYCASIRDAAQEARVAWQAKGAARQHRDAHTRRGSPTSSGCASEVEGGARPAPRSICRTSRGEA